MSERVSIAARLVRDTELAAQGDKGYWALVETMRDFIVKSAFLWARYAARGGLTLETEDLVSEGLIGAYRAAEKYDPSRGVLYSTYASWWIRAAQVAYIENHGRVVRVASRALKSKSEDRDLSTFLGAVTEAAHHHREVPLDASPDAPHSHNYAAVLPWEGEAPDVTVLRHERVRALRRAMKKLPARLRDIVRRRSRNEKLSDIGETYNLSRERVRQLEVQAYHALREHLARIGVGRDG